MADEYYGDSGGDEASGSGEGMAGGESDGRVGDDAQETTLVPKSIFRNQDIKPGDEETFEVVAIHENEVEVRCKYDEEEGEKGENETPESAFNSNFAMKGEGGGGEM